MDGGGLYYVKLHDGGAKFMHIKTPKRQGCRHFFKGEEKSPPKTTFRSFSFLYIYTTKAMFGLRRFAIERPVIFWSFVLGSIGKHGTICIRLLVHRIGGRCGGSLQQKRISVTWIDN
jgi:hypothetical protein